MNSTDTSTAILSFGSQVTLSIMPRLSSAISIVALIYAVQFIVRSRQRMHVLSNRLFLGMYIADIFRCLAFVTGTWMIPVGTDGVFMATGNNTSCAIQAFISQLGFMVPLYAVSVSGYFVLAMRHNFNFVRYKWTEKWCHICPIFVSLLLAILLIVNKSYGVDGKLTMRALVSLPVRGYIACFARGGLIRLYGNFSIPTQNPSNIVLFFENIHLHRSVEVLDKTKPSQMLQQRVLHRKRSRVYTFPPN